jgi:DNA-binding response OmpR family regulator
VRVLSASAVFGRRRRSFSGDDGAGAATGNGPGSASCGRHLPTVLLASGDRRRRLQLGRQLRRHGFYVRTAVDGPSALAAASRYQPAAIVAEWLMPGTGGTDVCRGLRRHPVLCRVPVVLIAARGDGAQVAEGFQAGADEVLTQPYETGELVGFLERNMAWVTQR